MARSARLATVRQMWACAAARLPAGKINSSSLGNCALYFSKDASKTKMASALSNSKPGMDNSPPKLNSWCCTSTNKCRTSSGIFSQSKSPMCEFNSSTSPMACTRKLFLDTRWLLPKPVVPSSPVRVAICVSRLPMVFPLCLNDSKKACLSVNSDFDRVCRHYADQGQRVGPVH